MKNARPWFDRHRNELVLIVILTGIATGALFWFAGIENLSKGKAVLEKFALALLVGVIVRSVALVFSVSERSVGDYRSSKSDYEEAVRSATASIWVSQTWLPAFAAQAADILNPRRPDTRIMLASFKNNSFIFSRISGRVEAHDPGDAKRNVAQCARFFVHLVSDGHLRFSYGHHPGWITIIDGKDVFWGPTPIDKDNNTSSEPACWNRDRIDGEQGRFWLEQFDLLWKKHSCVLKEEAQYNPQLAGLLDSDKAAT